VFHWSAQLRKIFSKLWVTQKSMWSSLMSHMRSSVCMRHHMEVKQMVLPIASYNEALTQMMDDGLQYNATEAMVTKHKYALACRQRFDTGRLLGTADVLKASSIMLSKARGKTRTVKLMWTCVHKQTRIHTQTVNPRALLASYYYYCRSTPT
jgi:hypothetical protein